MEAIFLKILNMSITAGWIVLAVVLLRLLLQKAPKWITCLLWALVGVRLVLPFSIESALSLIPSKETVSPEIMTSPAPTIHSGIEYFNSMVNPVISDALAPDPVKGTTPVVTIVGILALVWSVGILAMLIYSAVSYLRIRRRVKISIETEKGIFICDSINTPFILGLIKPKIYLPSTISEEDAQYVLAHEKAHIKRHDHLIKPFGFLLLSIYWFNPLLWLGYILLCRDIELACDEKVMKSSDIESKKSYSTALLNCSIQRRMISACPLAFGEVGVKKRIKNILNYKKPAFWIIIVALIITIVASVCLLTNPVEDNTEELSATIQTDVPETLVVFPESNSNNNYLKFSYTDPDIHLKSSYLKLYPKNNRFEFMLNPLSSYLPIGTYNIEGDKLILNTDGNNDTFVFRIKDTGENKVFMDKDSSEYTIAFTTLEFVENESTKIPKYKFSEDAPNALSAIDNGAVFSLEYSSSLYTNDVYDTISYDIDRNGVKEDIALTTGPTYGRLTLGISISRNGEKIYNTIFEPYWKDLTFTVHDDRLYLRGVTIDKPYTEEEIEVRWENNAIRFIKDSFPYCYEYEPSFYSAAETIKRYISAYDTHDAKLLNTCFTELIIDPNNKEAADALINTVTDCRLIEATFSEPNFINLTAKVSYEITYSDDYIPVGNRKPGKNLITCTFTLENTDGEFLISNMGIETVEHYN